MADISSIKLPSGTTYTVKDSTARNHIGNKSNPHGVTKAQVGLGNVDNTADSSKVVKGLLDYNDANRTIQIGYAGSGLTTTKYFAAYDSTGTKIKGITTAVAKAVMSLDNVANYDQSKAIKSISRSGTTFTATALDGTTFTFTQQDNNTTYGVATHNENGLMSSSDKTKLDSLSTTSVSAITNSEIDSIVAS
jgi:hypothetical protein|nr:MAG TPA: hypothetical protein [Caudoviricetes sp.]